MPEERRRMVRWLPVISSFTALEDLFWKSFRGDLIRGSVGVLSTSQFISLFIGVAGILILNPQKQRKSRQTFLNGIKASGVIRLWME